MKIYSFKHPASNDEINKEIGFIYHKNNNMLGSGNQIHFIVIENVKHYYVIWQHSAKPCIIYMYKNEPLDYASDSESYYSEIDDYEFDSLKEAIAYVASRETKLGQILL